MFAFVAPAVTGFGQAVSGTALCRAPVVARSAVSMKLSPAMPFMNQPAALDDATIPGNSGFDPFSFSETFDLKFMQEAEIKHCRIAMLAFLGMIVPEVVQIAGFPKISVVAAHDYFVKEGGMSQILLFCSFFELFGAIALKETMYEGSDRAPGYFGFDPLNFSKTPELAKKYQTHELRNGRLAMLGVSGLLTQTVLYNIGSLEQLTNFKAIPGHVF